jgi:hypothetical protein
MVPLFAGSAASVLLSLGAVIGVGDALPYYPTSVVPNLPGPDEARAILAEEQMGVVRSLRRAHRRSVEQGWVGIPVLDRVSPDQSADPDGP